jgi:alkyl hydroperoxide reductase subunit AhpC
MTAYQGGIAKFEDMGYQVLAVSTDNQPTLNHWAEELKATFPMMSDFMRKVSADYGVLMPDRGIANRTTFVIDPDGKIQYIEEGNTAVDISGAVTACSRAQHK